MLLYRPNAEIVDASGRHHSRSMQAETAVASGSRPPVLAEETRVTHDPLQATIVFDLPANIPSPRLMVTEGWIVDKTIKLGLMNDENSISHKRTYQALSAADSRIVSAGNR